MTSARTWTRGDRAVSALAAPDQDFLTTTGIDAGTFGYLSVEPTLETSLNGVVLAYDSDTAICCTPAGVVAQEAELNRFVNSSVERFVASMHRMARYVDEVQVAADDDEALDVVHATIADLRAIDAAAWSSEHSYWPVVAQQMIAGML